MSAAGSLLTRHRPQTFAEMIGQDDAIAALKTAADNGSHAFLLVGPSGVGKTTLARIGAKHLHADQVIEVDAATASGADDMRELTRVCDYRLTGTRAIIIDEAHRLSQQVWTTLAKPIEEPPEGLIWFLATTDPDRVPDHIQTRCTPLRLHDVSRNQLITLLEKVCKKERWKTPTEVLALCAQYALGSPRRALLHLATCSRCEDRDAAARLINAPLSKAAASVAQQRDGFTDLELALRRCEKTLARNADILGELNEAVDRLTVRITALERAAGVITSPAMPRLTRRRPLG